METTLDVRPVTTEIGAEIRGVDLRDELDDKTIDALKQALQDHLVLFFRDQHITPAQHLAFAQRFGRISVAPFGPKHPDFPEITVLDQITPKGEGADNWHADNTFMPEPPMGSILRGVMIPDVGGDTCFASGYAAYEGLSPALQRFVDELTAVHDISRMLRMAIANGQATEPFEQMQRTWPPHHHPVVRTNPDTGRKCLYVNGNWTARIIGLTERENETLLPMLIDHIRAPEYQCRFRWAEDSIAFWDNRWVQHYGVADYGGHRRIMQRVTLEGGPVV
ncbi:MAG TPA: TauD/TfdA family dioxygenase [Acidimicrobiales bacterium]|jgi:taurine dioxygenase|nr:TauD/TfdA family dioxygenase [Acidimicrobiales bacterium]